MAWYQSRKHLLDFVNGHNIESGIYIETDCVKWISRFGEDIRKLDPNEQPKPGIKSMKVLISVEDIVTEEVVVEEPVAEEVVAEIAAPVREALTKLKEVKPPVTRRKVSNTEESSDD